MVCYLLEMEVAEIIKKETVTEDECIFLIQEYIYEKKGERIEIMPIEVQRMGQHSPVILQQLLHNFYLTALNHFLTK